MARIHNFLREQLSLSVASSSTQTNRYVDLASSTRDQALGFQVPEDHTPAQKAKRKARAGGFPLLLAEDAEKNFRKMIPVTEDMLSEGMAFLEEVGLD
jgi:hypothetical protein